VRFLLNIEAINLEKAPGVIRLFGTVLGVTGAGTEQSKFRLKDYFNPNTL
jgi:hypothetical protein